MISWIIRLASSLFIFYILMIVVLIFVQISMIVFGKKKFSSLKYSLKIILLWGLAILTEDGREKLYRIHSKEWN